MKYSLIDPLKRCRYRVSFRRKAVNSRDNNSKAIEPCHLEGLNPTTPFLHTTEVNEVLLSHDRNFSFGVSMYHASMCVIQSR